MAKKNRLRTLSQAAESKGIKSGVVVKPGRTSREINVKPDGLPIIRLGEWS